jgi:exodeoxyribonuclease V alpha subunit
MTIHKSQGSEFERVVVILPEKEQMAILTRELLYTAVTRAKEHVLLIGDADVINLAIKRKVSRASGIKDRIINREV